MLLHLQLPLSLHADSPDATLLRAFPVPLLADVHTLEKPSWDGGRILLHQGRAVCHVYYFAVRVGRLFDCENGSVRPMLRLLRFCGLSSSGE